MNDLTKVKPKLSRANKSCSFMFSIWAPNGIDSPIPLALPPAIYTVFLLGQLYCAPWWMSYGPSISNILQFQLKVQLHHQSFMQWSHRKWFVGTATMPHGALPQLLSISLSVLHFPCLYNHYHIKDSKLNIKLITAVLSSMYWYLGKSFLLSQHS